jgi:predicted transcriptional regulator of viral defense system
MESDTVSLYLSQAIVQLLTERNVPLVTEYTLHQQVRPLLDAGTLGSEKILRLPSHWEHAQLRTMIRTLEKRRVLAPDDDFKAGVWRVVQAASAPTAEEAVCLVDPFAYISHLSAMQRYGLTDRAPEALHVTTPARALWTRLRDARMDQDYGSETYKASLPQLTRIGLKQSVRRRPVVLHESSHPAEPVPIAGSVSRIAAIGRVFVDMLDQPALCGGIQHVLDSFDRHAETWLDEIIAAVDATESPIVKVRAGYILDEMLGLSRPTVERWTSCAQRGGSRKLDPQAPYGNLFSEKWMIALNV